jgi:epoxyqueuosine reductase
VTTAGRLADEVRRIGQDAGLDAVGICAAHPFEETRRVLEDRKSRGLSAGMQFTYRNPRRSTDPQATLAGAAALVVGARRYERSIDDSQASGDQPRPAPEGRVAMYSWIDHYQPLRAALGMVADHLVGQGWRARVLVDDNALVDRAAAVRSGIGWYGKNANVLLPGLGSWFVLGSVVTDAPLAAGMPAPQAVPDGCGPCGRCLSACPTGALIGGGQLDARRCLAWLLQAPGVFPPQYREALGDRLYGCDDCQTVCPVNRLATRRDAPPEAEPEAQPSVDILDLLAASDEALMELVGRWYIPGREPRYVRRNALIVLGNTGDPSAPAVVAAVARALRDPDPIVRSHAVWAAARLGRRDLLRALQPDCDPLVAAEIARAARAAGAASPPVAVAGGAGAGVTVTAVTVTAVTATGASAPTGPQP